jgi:hypothetical protein
VACGPGGWWLVADGGWRLPAPIRQLLSPLKHDDDDDDDDDDDEEEVLVSFWEAEALVFDFFSEKATPQQGPARVARRNGGCSKAVRRPGCGVALFVLIGALRSFVTKEPRNSQYFMRARAAAQGSRGSRIGNSWGCST